MNKLKNIKFENVFYLLLVFFIANLILNESQFNNIGGCYFVLKIIRLLLIAIISLFALYNKVEKKILIPLLLLLFALIINFLFFDGGLSVIPLLLLMMLSKGHSLSKVFKYSACTVITMFLFVIVCSLCGVLNDDVQILVRGEETGSFFSGLYARHDMGFLVHNQIPIAFFMVYMMFIVYKNDGIKWYENVVVLALNYIIFLKCGSRIAFALVVAACFGYYCVRFMRNRAITFIMRGFAIVSFPLCCFLSFYFAYNYTSDLNVYSMLDRIFSNRLRLSSEALSYYGLHLVGAGKYAATYSSALLENNTVDNGYISFFIQNGIIAGSVMLGIWIYIAYISTKNRNVYLMLTLLLISVEIFINPHLGSFLLLPFYCIVMNSSDSLITREKASHAYK